MPPASAPPSGPPGFCSLNSPATLQSCGRSSVGHAASANVASCAPGTSPRWNRQAPSKASVARSWADAVAQSVTSSAWRATTATGDAGIRPTDLVRNEDALARIRTGMPCGAAPSRQCVYQFHHQGGSRKLGLRPAGIKQDLASGASRDTLHAMELWVAFAFGAAVGAFVGVLIGRYRAAARRGE